MPMIELMVYAAGEKVSNFSLYEKCEAKNGIRVLLELSWLEYVKYIIPKS